MKRMKKSQTITWSVMKNEVEGQEYRGNAQLAHGRFAINE